jgi:hypothetical protein
MNIDIATTVRVILVLLAIAMATSVVMAMRSINAGRKLEFYRKRQDLISYGWRLILLAVGIGISGFLLVKFGEPVAYHYFPPSPTVTQTPTITITPTITETPSQTFTPTQTLTLQYTYTPELPAEIQATIMTPVGVDKNAVFSILSFSTQTKDGVVINTTTYFDPPVTQLYGGFSYDKMALGVQWSAVWKYGNEIICSETKVWSYAPGGYGYTDCKRPSAEWLPGEYEVQIFVGSQWKNSGRFVIRGEGGSAASGSTTPSFQPPQTPTPQKP